MMRVMLLANIDTPFANGTQGRLLAWSPEKAGGKYPLPATHGEISVRFARESSLKKPEMHIEVDYVDVKARRETILSSRGHPALLQVPVAPANALCVHKCQSLTIRHIVQGCLEGFFAWGQFYTQASRAVDPQNYQLIGLPPADLVDDVAAAWRAAGLDVNDCFKKACSVTNEWVYTEAGAREDPATGVLERLHTRAKFGWRSKIKLGTIQQLLHPQAQAADVFLALLTWIDGADNASQHGMPPPEFIRPDGKPIFPKDERWWLTDAQIQGRAPINPQPMDGDGPDSECDLKPISNVQLETEKEWSEESEQETGSQEDPSPLRLSLCNAVLADSRMQAQEQGMQSWDARPMWCRPQGIQDDLCESPRKAAAVKADNEEPSPLTPDSRLILQMVEALADGRPDEAEYMAEAMDSELPKTTPTPKLCNSLEH